MSVEIIRLGGSRLQLEPETQVVNARQWPVPVFKTHQLPQPPMSIWMMTMPAGLPIFPWWNYAPAMDEDIQTLNRTFAITSSQNLFDCLLLSQLRKFSPGNFYTIFPGGIKTEGWKQLRDEDKELFTNAQTCQYHLHGGHDGKLTVNWVPFWEPQSLVKNVPFGSLWRLFRANPGDNYTRCLTFFGLEDRNKYHEVVNLLLTRDDRRSEQLCSLVDWFGFYSSPMDTRHGACAVIYTLNDTVKKQLEAMESQITTTISQAQLDLLAEPHPHTVFRSMSRLIAL